MPNFYVCKVINNGAYDLQDTFAEYIVSMLPDVKAFRWTDKYINDPSFMPDLKWQKQ